MRILKKAFTEPVFTIALRKNTGSAPHGAEFRACSHMRAHAGHWFADPILAQVNGETLLFFEEVRGVRATISVARVLPDGGIMTPEAVLSEPFHLSFPFVFELEGDFYMIPETCKCSQIILYRAKRFPAEWERLCVLAEDINAVDTLVYEKDGRLLLLTFEADRRTERVTPRAAELLHANGSFYLEPMTWDSFDPLVVRAAGPMFEHGGETLRPAQISTEHDYGRALAFYAASVDFDARAYSETPRGTLTPDMISVPGLNKRLRGIHSYSRCGSFEAIDVKYDAFSPAKPLRRLLRRLGRGKRS